MLHVSSWKRDSPHWYLIDITSIQPATQRVQLVLERISCTWYCLLHELFSCELNRPEMRNAQSLSLFTWSYHVNHCKVKNIISLQVSGDLEIYFHEKITQLVPGIGWVNLESSTLFERCKLSCPCTFQLYVLSANILGRILIHGSLIFCWGYFFFDTINVKTVFRTLS